MRDDSWRDRAACRGSDVELFFSSAEADVAAALALCSRCPVRVPCLDLAMGGREAFGVWGGTLDIERRRVFRKQRRKHDAA